SEKSRRNHCYVDQLKLDFFVNLKCCFICLVVPILNLMDLPSEIMGEAKAYMQIVGGLIFIQALIMTTGAILRSYGLYERYNERNDCHEYFKCHRKLFCYFWTLWISSSRSCRCCIFNSN